MIEPSVEPLSAGLAIRLPSFDAGSFNDFFHLQSSGSSQRFESCPQRLIEAVSEDRAHRDRKYRQHMGQNE